MVDWSSENKVLFVDKKSIIPALIQSVQHTKISAFNLLISWNNSDEKWLFVSLNPILF